MLILTILISNLILKARGLEQDKLVVDYCTTSQDCAIFQIPDNPNVTCTDLSCNCLDKSNRSVECKPHISNISNVIGGDCPCKIENSECKKDEGACYCLKGYTVSNNRRKCVREAVQLGEKCESHGQCHKSNSRTECGGGGKVNGTKICKCQSRFTDYKGICVPIVAWNGTCVANEQCYNATLHSKCDNEKCVCEEGYFTSSNRQKCLPGVNYNDSCEECSQCKHNLGTGAICVEKRCKCDKRHFISDTDNGNKKCELKVQLNQYCLEHKDCHQFDLKEQIMECKRSHCTYKDPKSSSGLIIPVSALLMATLLYTTLCGLKRF